jgi:large subunit ribosomal protein L14
MVQVSTNLSVIDNSGVKSVQCIRVLGGHKKQIASLGELIVVAVKKTLPKTKVKKGQVRKAIVIKSRLPLFRKDGTKLLFDNNGTILLNEQNAPIGTRILGPVTQELRKTSFMKIVSLSKRVL